MKILVGNDYSFVEEATGKELELINSELSVKVSGYYFSPAFRRGGWDGREHFFNKNRKAFPTGLLYLVKKLFDNAVDIEDIREGRKIPLPEKIVLHNDDNDITLRDYQYNSVKEALTLKRGVINVATNGGKTEIAAGIIQQILPKLRKGESILFVTHAKEIFHQSAERLEKRLGIPIGKVGDGEWTTRPVTVVMIPTVSRYLKHVSKLPEKSYSKEMKAIVLIMDMVGTYMKKGGQTRDVFIQTLQFLENESNSEESIRQKAVDIITGILSEEKTNLGCLDHYNKLKKHFYEERKAKLDSSNANYIITMDLLKSAYCLIGDEIHHSSSKTWYDTLMLCENAVYRFGLTGTVDKSDPVNVMRLFGCVGPIISKVSNDYLITHGYSAKPIIYLQTINNMEIKDVDWHGAYKFGIVENEYRNQLIVEKVEEKYNQGKGCLVIVSQIKHGEHLKDMLEDMGVECEFSNGQRDSEERKQVLSDMRKGRLKVLIATNILDEGVDISGINCIWMVAAGKSYRQVLQRVGRGLRVKEDGSCVEIYDFLDYTNEYLTKHTMERYKYYREEKFEVHKL